MIRFLKCLLGLVAILALPAPAAGASGKVVVELFTSQGCSSCPPADALLRELGRRDDVIALSMHVDYWNYLGWKDPFAAPETTRRQRDYGARLGLRYVYTPQMVIAGRDQAPGSEKATVLRAIEAARAAPSIDVSVVHSGQGEIVVRIADGEVPEPATVWLFAFDAEHVTEIHRGENRGIRLVNANVVRAVREIGRWTGAATEIRVKIAELVADGRDGCAVVVQQGSGGPILGAASLRFAR